MGTLSSTAFVATPIRAIAFRPGGIGDAAVISSNISRQLSALLSVTSVEAPFAVLSLASSGANVGFIRDPAVGMSASATFVRMMIGAVPPTFRRRVKLPVNVVPDCNRMMSPGLDVSMAA